MKPIEVMRDKAIMCPYCHSPYTPQVEFRCFWEDSEDPGKYVDEFCTLDDAHSCELFRVHMEWGQ